MSQTPLSGSKLKIERAKRHISDLEAEVRAFHARNPYEVFPDDDPQTGDLLYRVHILEEVPPCLSTFIGDIIHNLRASFDLMASDVVEAGGGRRDKAYFPVCHTTEAFKSDGRSKIKGASQKAVDLIESLQPYYAGNEPILRLHKLDILDKHRSIIPVGAASSAVDPGIVMKVPWRDEPIVAPPLFIRPSDRQYPLKDGAVIYIVRAGSRETAAQDNPKFMFDVAFGEGQIIDGEPIIPALTQLIQFTTQALDDFRREIFA